MNKKIKLVLIIILIIASFFCGLFVGSNKNEDSNKNTTDNTMSNKIRYNLDGVYLTEIQGTKNPEKSINHTYIDSMTFYSNGTVSIYRINIYDVKGIGTKIDKGTINSGTYTLSNESNTILIRQEKVSKTLTFENEYKTLKYEDTPYNLITGKMEDYLPKETLNDERNTEFSGTYLFEEITDKRTPTSSTQYKGKTIEQKVNRKYLTFLENGKIKIKYDDVVEYVDGTSENYSNSEHEYLYSIDKENKTILVYMSTSNYDNYTISDDLKEIKDRNKFVYKIVN